MARKPPKVEADDSPKAKQAAADKKLLTELRERYKKCVEADKDNRKKYKANMRFTLIPGEQWDAATKKERGQDRVMYEFNETRIKCKAVVNQIRSNRPSAKITPAEDGDVEIAEAMKGLIDQVQNASDAESVMDYATEHQVIGGMGAERYITRYVEDSVDEQEICIEPVKNPMCLYADYACQKQDKSDARFWILAAKLQKDVYKAKYPKAEPVEFEVEDEFEDDCGEDEVWVAEYWTKVPVTRRLALLSDGKTVDMANIQALPEGVTIIKERTAPGHRIVQYICSGDAVLTDEAGIREHEWAGKHFPFNIAYGEYAVVDGKEIWYGLPEHGKDAQRAHNWAATSVFETIASTPQGTTWVTEVQANNLMPEWAEAQRKNIRIKRYNHDQRAPGPPVSEPPASVPTALVAAMQMSSDSLKAVLGMPDATLGEKGAENSGIAIRRRQEAGAVANYNFGDNMTKFVRRRHEILLDLIPKVYDTPRSIRILGQDGAEKWVKVNSVDPVTNERLNDLSAAKYDLVVTQGPNYATQRQEAAETYMGMSQSNPALQAVAGDLIFKSLDLPYAQEIGERLKATLPPQISAMLNKDKPQDPAVIAAMAQVEQLQMQLQEQSQLVEQASQEAQSEKAGADKAKADVQIALANLKTEQANLATQVAQFQALVANTQAKFAEMDRADADTKAAGEAESQSSERESLVNGIGEALAGLQQQSAEQTQALATLMQELAAAQPVSGPKTAVSRRVDGGYDTEIVDSVTGERKVARSRKVNGEMVTQIVPADTVQ